MSRLSLPSQTASKTPSPPAAEAPGLSRPNLQIYVTILRGIQEQIRFADAKAAFLTALNVALFGFLALRVDGALVTYAKRGTGGPIFTLALVVQLLYLTAAASAIAAVVFSIMPRFGELAPKSKVFFRRIVRDYGKDWPKYVEDLNALSDEDWAEQVGAQIVEISHVAVVKHQLMRRAAWLTLLAFVLWRASLLTIAFLPAN